METSSRYRKCLSTWGFRDGPFTEKHPYTELFWARPKEPFEFMKFLLEDAKAKPRVMNVLVSGDYGSGKTYMLHTLKVFIERDLDGLGIIIQIPTKYRIRGFRDILSQLMSKIGAERLIQAGKEIMSQRGFEKPEDLLGLLKSELANDDVARAIYNLICNQDYALTVAWLSGEASLHQIRALGFSSSSREEEVVVVVIADILKFLGYVFPLVGIFIDELENLIGESRPIRSIREGLRNLYDEAIYGDIVGSIVLFTAATASTLFEIEMTLGGALLDRTDQDVALQPLSEEETRRFVLDVMNRERLNSTQRNHITPPFQDEKAFKQFIKLIPSTSTVPRRNIFGGKGTPRRILKVGKFLLQRACFKKKVHLDANAVQEILGGSD